MNFFIKIFSRWLQSELDRPPTFQRCPPVAINMRQRTLRKQADLDSANQFLFIGGRDLGGSVGIKTTQDTMQISRGMTIAARPQSIAQFFRSLRNIGQSFEKSS